MKKFKFILVHNSMNTMDDAAEALYDEKGLLLACTEQGRIKQRLRIILDYAKEHGDKNEPHGFVAEVYMSPGEIEKFPVHFEDLKDYELTKKDDLF